MYFNRLEQYSERLAIVGLDGRRISYGELARAADDFAARLPAEKSLIFIEMDNAVEPIVAYLGALRHRHTVLLVERTGTSAFAKLVDTFRPHFVYRRDSAGDMILDRLESDTVLHPDVALLLSTSGSTGSIKLVRLSYENIASNADAIAEYLGIDGSHRTITTLPPHYSFGMSVINSHLAAGAAIVLTQELVTSDTFWALFRANEVSSFAGVPYTYELLERRRFADMELPSLKYFTQAGGRLAPEKVRALADWAAARQKKFFVMYGQTEAGPRISYLPPDMAHDHPDCIGVPVPGGKLSIVDDDGNPVDQPDVPGELVYVGPNVMMGYASSSADLALGASTAALSTGDIACRNKDGLFYIVGRKKRFIKPYGYRVNLDELQEQLQDSGFSGVCVGTDAHVTVALQEIGQADAALAALQRKLDLPGHIFEFVELPEIPRLASGKIDFQQVQKIAEAALTERRSSLDTADPARSGSWLDRMVHRVADVIGIQRQNFKNIAAAYAWVFNKRQIDPGESFVSLGGDSLSYIVVSDVIQNHLGHLPADWEKMPIAELDAVGRSQRAKFTIPSDVLIRALAIMGVVAAHLSLSPFEGGSNVLMILAGLSFGKFMWADNPQAVVGAIGKRMPNLLFPSLIMICLAFAWTGEFRWPTLLFFENLITRTDPYWFAPLWFLQVLFQTYILLALISYTPGVAKFGARNEFLFAVLFTISAVAVKCVLAVSLGTDVQTGEYLPQYFFWQFGIGWMIFASKTKTERMVTFGMLVASILLVHSLRDFTGDNSGDPHRMALIVLGCGFLLLFERVRMPKAVGVGVSLVAMASYYIYLFHLTLWTVERGVLGILPPIVEFVLVMIGSVGVWIVSEVLIKEFAPNFHWPKRIFKRA